MRTTTIEETKDELRAMGVTSDSDLGPDEKETVVTFPNDTDRGLFHSEVPTLIKWFLSVEESTVTNYRTEEGEIVAITGTIPKSIVKFQGNARKSTAHSQMVTYGPGRE